MIDKLRRFSRIVDLVNDKVAFVVSFLLFGLFGFITFEVFSRYFFHKPTIWCMELTQFLYCYIIALGGAYTLRIHGHVNVDILFTRLKPRVKTIISMIIITLIIIFLAIVLWQTGMDAIEVFNRNEHSGSAFNPPIFPVKIIIPIGVLLFIFQGIAMIIKYLIELITGVVEEERQSF